jgi:hypothetical protein
MSEGEESSMHKGFKSTLLTVAVALLGFKAMATAPTITDIPDVIIGDAENGTPSNIFVYPDAINLDNFVSDTDTTDGGIIWSYTGGGGTYLLNGIGPNAGDLVSPAAGARLNNNANTDPRSSDSQARTITFRNNVHSPLASEPVTSGYTAAPTSETQTVTLVASDSSTISSKSILVYTDDNGDDQTSGSGGIQILTLDFTTGTNGWTQYSTFISDGGTVGHAQNASGLCLTSSAGGNIIAGWTSAPAYNNNPANAFHTVALVNNAVYEFRMSVTSTAVSGRTPIWTLFVQNTFDVYGAQAAFFDNGGTGNNPGPGADAPVGTPGGTRPVFTWFYAAAGSEAPAFQNWVTTPANAANLDMRVQLGIFDPAVPLAYGGADLDAGTICFKSLEVSRHDRTALSVTATPYNATNLTDAPVGTAGVEDLTVGDVDVSDFSTGAGTTNVTYVAGDVVISPSSTSAWETNQAFVIVRPGDGTVSTTAAGSPDMRDNYPVPWKTDQLYKISFRMRANSALGESNPLDFAFLGGVTLSNEILCNAYMTNAQGAVSMPKQTAADYVVYWHGNNRTLEPGNWQRFGPTLQLGSNATFTVPTNQGGLALESIKVEEVTP